MLRQKEKIMQFISLLLIFSYCYLYPGMLTVAGANKNYIHLLRSRQDLVESSLAIWSGFSDELNHCCFHCLRASGCVSILYNSNDKSCKLFNIIYSTEKSEEADSIQYFILGSGDTRRVPKSCKDLANCSGISTDGEYWIYPLATGGQRVKIYCHNMGADPSEYISLIHENSFTHHKGANQPIDAVPCQSTYIPPLKKANSAKLAINMQTMEVQGTDYTFATLTGGQSLPYGQIHDCNGEYYRSACPYFSSALINTRGTGFIIDPSVTWGKVSGWETEIKDMQRSTDGAEISFGCLGFCGICGLSSESITFQFTEEFVSSAEATALICQL